jgi:hypothetical protein
MYLDVQARHGYPTAVCWFWGFMKRLKKAINEQGNILWYAVMKKILVQEKRADGF